MFVSSEVICGFKHRLCQTKDYCIKLVFVVSQLNMQHKGVRAETGWLGIRIICVSGVACHELLFQ